MTFDFWQTLMSESAGHLSGLRRTAWAALLAEAGFDVPDDALRAAFDRSWGRYETNWIAGRQYRAEDAAQDVLRDLNLDLPAPTRRALIDAMVGAGRDADLRPAPGIEGALRRLKGNGIRIGIVCDVGMTGSPILLAQLEHHGILPLFDHWSFSDVVGCYKPDPRIFEHALAGLGGVDPHRVVHVGDRLRTDVAGAHGMGMTAVRYTGLFDDPAEDIPEADHVIARHDELAGALGLA